MSLLQHSISFTGLCCKRDLYLIDPTNRSHPIRSFSLLSPPRAHDMTVYVNLSVSLSLCTSISVSLSLLMSLSVPLSPCGVVRNAGTDQTTATQMQRALIAGRRKKKRVNSASARHPLSVKELAAPSRVPAISGIMATALPVTIITNAPIKHTTATEMRIVTMFQAPSIAPVVMGS